MKLGLSLFILYAIGKVIAVAIHNFEFGFASIPVLLWQDAVVAGVVGVTFYYSKPTGWVAYGIAVLHFAISMPLLRLMATPLTVPLLRAGSGTLADSMNHHLDIRNILLLLGTIVIGAALPFALQRICRPVHPALGVVAAAGILAGYSLTASSSLQGLHRNSVVAFAQSFPRAAEATELNPHATRQKHSAHRGLLKGANVILIGLESTGIKHLASYGAVSDPMPFLSRLAQEGVTFEKAYAPYPESIKGLFALLFSRQPRFGFDPEDLAAHHDPSLAGIAGHHGYDTALFHSGRFMYLGMDNVVTAAGFNHSADAGAISGNHNSSFGVDDFSTVDHLLNWFDRRSATNPFFVHYLPISGHHPYEAPIRSPFAGADDESRYRNALHYSDLAFKKLVDGLQQRDLLANTLLVIYGDHGEAFGEHPGNYGHTLYLYEENVRVPLIFWMPAKLQPARVPRITSLVDIAPTVCDLLGLTAPQTFEGASAFDPGDHSALFCTDYSMRLRGIRFADWKLILEKDTGYTRLYNLAQDPSERTNLAGFHPEIVSTLRGRFFEWSRTGARAIISPNHETMAQR